MPTSHGLGLILLIQFLSIREYTVYPFVRVKAIMAAGVNYYLASAVLAFQTYISTLAVNLAIHT
jgi:hypothetical protein